MSQAQRLREESEVAAALPLQHALAMPQSGEYSTGLMHTLLTQSIFAAARVRRLSLRTFLVLALVVSTTTATGGERLDRLQILQDQYPRAFFFRITESRAAQPRVSYPAWDREFSRLMGIIGKALDEEVPGRSRRNIDFFTRFKQAHPDQLVLLHYNGNARDPRWESQRFFAGHWLYYNGARILSDVPAETGVTDIRVSDASLFRVNIGRYRDANEDIGLCELDAQGRPDWRYSEQVQLVSVDMERSVIRVRRGCYGTQPRAFRATRAYAAAHCTEGPWGRQSHLLWYYNYSTCCPRDAQGRTCADVHVEHLAELFGPEGPLAAFDGLEFDVLHDHCGATRGKRIADADADGKGDGGLFDGFNAYGAGVIEFCRKLRQRLGSDHIVQADGAAGRFGEYSQRAFALLNGIESEGWPHLSDWELRRWSSGLNRHMFWQANAHPPAFNYINHKFVTPGPEPGETGRPAVPWSTHRVVMAAAMFTDAGICYSFTPPPEPDGLTGVWDELWMGTEHRLGWLGRPLGPAVHLAVSQPDQLKGLGTPVKPALLEKCHAELGAVLRDGETLRLEGAQAAASSIRLRLRDVPCNGPDLYVQLKVWGRPMANYPSEAARWLRVGIAPPEGWLVRPELPRTAQALRGKPETPLSPDSGASVQYQPALTLGSETHAAYFVHPPFRNRAAGYTVWERTVRVPAQGWLEFYTGMSERAPSRSDGVVFIVQIEPLDAAGAKQTEIFRHTQKESRWVKHIVPLVKWAGQTVRLRFVSDCGPADNTTTDQSYWGEVQVLSPAAAKKARTQPVQQATLFNQKPFVAGFYFDAIQSPSVDLEFEVESTEPVWIADFTVHAAPDAMWREFEHGLVLANPSPRPYTFDLGSAFPKTRFRRIQGSARQDPAVNNGQSAGASVRLAGRDALFLIKDE